MGSCTASHAVPACECEPVKRTKERGRQGTERERAGTRSCQGAEDDRLSPKNVPFHAGRVTLLGEVMTEVMTGHDRVYDRS